MPRTKKETLNDEVIIEESKKTKAKRTTTKKASTKKESSATAKKATTKKSTTTTKKATTKKSSTTAKKATSKKSTTTSKKATTSTAKKSTRKTSAKVTKSSTSKKDKVLDDVVENTFENIVEYYDLPYRYNQTVVKVLYQNPTTLFVYWDVSNEDIEVFKKEYGDNFLYITKPVLLVHNLTDNYSFEVEVNDFANNWYIHVEDSKCKYSVELCRRPNQSREIKNTLTKQSTDFINITYSNTVELPNDHILFFKENDRIYFKNVKTNKITEKVFKSSKHGSNVKAIYENYNLSENDNRFDFKNPSSQNPTSNVM